MYSLCESCKFSKIKPVKPDKAALMSQLKQKRTTRAIEDTKGYHLAQKIIAHRKTVIIVFVLFTIACALCVPHVKVNYDLASYLPSESNSSQALEIMDDTYGTEIPNARLYAQGISLSQASLLSDSLREVEGVNDVLWLGDQVDILQPLAMAGADVIDSWKSDTGFLYQLTIDGAIASEALDQVRAIAHEQGASDVALSGSAVTTVAAQEGTATEILYIMMLAVLIIIVIISLTSHSWFEWVIFLLVLAMAIIMNMGTNIFRGEISFITQICAAVLQLAVSMDYAIVMLHTFRRYQAQYPDDPKTAMAHAMHKGFSVILSSAAVTFFGFLSLSVMSFQIGVDMGIVLAKGILFSFLAIMVLMPCVLLACLRPLKRFEHKPLLPSFDKFGTWCARLMVPLSIVIALVAVPSFLGQGKTDFTYGNAGLIEEGTQSANEDELINSTFKAAETWVMIVPAYQWADEKALIADLEAEPEIENVISYATAVSERIPTEMVPETQRTQLIANDYSRIIIQTTLDANQATDYELVKTVRSIGEAHYGDAVYLAGTQVSEYDLKTTTSDDSLKVKLFSMGTIALVLLLMFRSLSIPLIVLLPIEISIWINLAVPYFTGQSINYIGYLVIDAVQLGAAVDYAIIYTREYLEQREKFPALQAARHAISHSAITIMTSALILTTAGISIFFIASNGIISEIGLLIGRGAFIAMLMMFTLLPLLFVIGDRLIKNTSIGLKFYSEEKKQNEKETSMNTKQSFSLAKGAVKKAGAMLCCVLLAMSTVPTTTAEAAEQPGNSSAQVTEKEEVVYTKLSPIGQVEGIYVVNSFQAAEQTRIKDPGIYTTVTNLSTSEDLVCENGMTEFTVPAGSLHYEGTLSDHESLPWNISVQYYLNGLRVNDTSSLAGVSGDLVIELSVEASGSDNSFSDNYLIQASGNLDSDSTKDLTLDNGSVATSGSDHQVTMMFMPDIIQTCRIEASVQDFSFDGFTIVGVPISFAFNLDEAGSSELGDLTGGINELQSAITDINSGAADLEQASTTIGNGIGSLGNNGTLLYRTSKQIQEGIGKTASATNGLASGSNSFMSALSKQQSEASEKASGFNTLATQKKGEYAQNMMDAQTSLGSAQTYLIQVEQAIRSNDQAAAATALQLLATELQTTGASLSDVNAVIGNADSEGLVSYQAQAAAYQASADTCNSIATSYTPLHEGSQNLASTLPQLSTAYSTYTDGLGAYLGGVSDLEEGYSAFQTGVTTLHNGTEEFESQTVDLDQELVSAVKDELKARLDPDFEMHSFADATNTQVNMVQFVFMTEGIENSSEEPTPEPETNEETFWTRLSALFSL